MIKLMGRVSKKSSIYYFSWQNVTLFLSTPSVLHILPSVSLGGAALSTVKNKLALREFEKENTTTIKSPTFIEQAVNNCFGGNGR